LRKNEKEGTRGVVEDEERGKRGRTAIAGRRTERIRSLYDSSTLRMVL